jgi:hypothetical protein
MLDSKPMTFMELVEALGISSPNLTYHLESLGDLISKSDSGHYRLSSFGQTSVSTLKGVEDVHNVAESKNRLLSQRRRLIFGIMLIVIVFLSCFSGLQVYQNSQLSKSNQALYAENQQLMSWGMGTSRVASFLRDVAYIDTNSYAITLLSNTLQWRTDFGGVTEEEVSYSLKSRTSNLNTLFRFRNGHFSRYELVMIESYPISTRHEANNLIVAAYAALSGYQEYSGDDYLTDMINLLSKVTSTQSTTIVEGNMKLRISTSGSSAELLWMFTENGIDYQSKGLQMTFQNNILVTMTDSYFLFEVGSSDISVTKEEAVSLAENYVTTLTATIEGEQVSGFKTLSPPLVVELVPHIRDNSVKLYPYWYVELRLDTIYSGGINIVAIGIYADTGQIVDVRLLRGSIEL